jgi:long-subunit acyl-CoA synthetase (AMP-forming)
MADTASMARTTRDVVAERAEITAAVAGKTVPSLFQQIAAQYADQPALMWRGADGAWQPTTWAQYRERVREVTLGLLSLGFGPGQFGVIMARNRPEHLIADLAITHAGGAGVSIYNTLAPEQIAYIVSHCGASVAFVEGHAFLAKFLAIRDQLPNLRHVVLMEGEPPAENAADGWVMTWDALVARGQQLDPQAFDAAWRRVQPSDLLALIYTSGTTGAPKGVTYTHNNVLWTVESSNRIYPIEMSGRVVSYLPLAHVAERFTSHWSGIYHAATTYLVPEPTQLLPALLQARPGFFVGVPRVWEKLQTGIQLGIAADDNEQRKALVQAAIAVGRELAEMQQRGETPPPELVGRYEAAAPVLEAVRAKIGLDQCQFAVTSTAPMPHSVLLFFAAIGLPISEVWGMSELTGPATGNPLERLKLGTVGVAYPGVEIRLDEDGELLVRGDSVMPGYYRDPQRTAEVLDADGWLRTGDVATVDDDGYFRIVDRKKELLITSSGKNISPANIEALLKHSPLIGQAIAVGDGRKFISALLVLDGEVAPAWARAHGITAETMAELAQHPAMIEAVRQGVAEANAHLSRVEQVKRFTLLPAEWTAESEELTPTLKLRRRIVTQKYAREITAMYAEPPGGIEVEPQMPPPGETEVPTPATPSKVEVPAPVAPVAARPADKVREARDERRESALARTVRSLWSALRG